MTLLYHFIKYHFARSIGTHKVIDKEIFISFTHYYRSVKNKKK